MSLALTRFPRQVSSLYGADLAGAALGCLVVGPMLRLTDAPTAVLVTAAVAAIAALLFATRWPNHLDRNLPTAGGCCGDSWRLRC